jgi:uncharacterized protein (TIGR03000 family)
VARSAVPVAGTADRAAVREAGTADRVRRLGGGSSGGRWHRVPAGGGYRSAYYARPAAPTVATVVVKVPQQAKVYLEGQEMSLTGSVRQFRSPALESGKDYVYTVRVDIERDGKTVSKTAKATVRAGSNVEVAVDFPEGNTTQLVANVRELNR